MVHARLGLRSFQSQSCIVTLSEVSAGGAQGAVSTIVMHALMVGEDQNVLNPSCYMVAST